MSAWLTSAHAGIARAGVTRAGGYLPTFCATVAGVSRAIAKDVKITQAERSADQRCTFTARGWTPDPGDQVKIGLGGLAGEALEFAGVIIHVADVCEADGTALAHDVTCAGWGWLLQQRLVWKTYTDESATDIITDLLTLAPAGFTSNHVAAGLPSTSITFTGQPLWDCIAAVMTRVGGQARVDQDQDVHAWTTTDDTNAPGDVTDSSHNVRVLRRERDLSQVRTRVYVQGQSTSTVAPVTAGDTTIAVDDASIFPSPTGCAMTSGAIMPYTGVTRDYTTPIRTEVASTPAGPFRVGLAQTTGLPANGWLKTSGGVLIKYDDISAWDVAVLLRGAAKIKAITRSSTYEAGSGYRVTVETLTPYRGSGALTICGASEADYNATFNYWEIDATHFGFWIGTTPGNCGEGGYCGAAGNWTITNITTSGTVATVTCSGWGHNARVGDWITVTGNSVADFNGTWLATAVPSTTTFQFTCRNSPWTGYNGTANLAGTPQSAMSANTAVSLCECLTGVSNSQACATGTALTLLAREDDATGQTTWGSTITDGIIEDVISDGTLTKTEAPSVGQAMLADTATVGITLRYRTWDKRTRPGRSVTFSTTTPLAVSGSYPIRRVSLSEFDATGQHWPARDVEAGKEPIGLGTLLGRIRQGA